MWRYYNPNPAGRTVGDCSIRAVARALGMSWDEAYETVCRAGQAMADMPSSDAVWGAVLRKNGFVRRSIPDRCPDCYTAEDFLREHPRGIYVLGFGGHVATAADGELYDSWDSLQEIPQFYWTREEERNV